VKGVEKIKAFVDKSGCIACGMSVSICPDAFQIGSNGLAEVYVDQYQKI